MVKNVEKDEEKERLNKYKDSDQKSILCFSPFQFGYMVKKKQTKNAIVISTRNILRNYINIVIGNKYRTVKST